MVSLQKHCNASFLRKIDRMCDDLLRKNRIVKYGNKCKAYNLPTTFLFTNAPYAQRRSKATLECAEESTSFANALTPTSTGHSRSVATPISNRTTATCIGNVVESEGEADVEIQCVLRRTHSDYAKTITTIDFVEAQPGNASACSSNTHKSLLVTSPHS